LTSAVRTIFRDVSNQSWKYNTTENKNMA